ncbi:hypothetical protein SEUCBS140593_010784, partial [Sporothrix eucalyptigena]
FQVTEAFRHVDEQKDSLALQDRLQKRDEFKADAIDATMADAGTGNPTLDHDNDSETVDFESDR